MAECENLLDCPYFNGTEISEIDVIVELRKQKYCLGDNSICARYMVFEALGREYCPKDLIPIQTDRAKEIIEQHKTNKSTV